MTTLPRKNARMIDGTTPDPVGPVDIAIEDGRFVETGANVVFDADDVPDTKTGIAMPGLIDCQVHVIATAANLGLNAELVGRAEIGRADARHADARFHHHA